VEKEVRQKVAERLSSLKSAPHELTKLLANDAIEIARPILHHSPVLTDTDLIEIVKALTADHRLAIAMRPQVSAASAKRYCGKEPRALQAACKPGQYSACDIRGLGRAVEDGRGCASAGCRAGICERHRAPHVLVRVGRAASHDPREIFGRRQRTRAIRRYSAERGAQAESKTKPVRWAWAK
jgi:hypothetical protein